LETFINGVRAQYFTNHYETQTPRKRHCKEYTITLNSAGGDRFLNIRLKTLLRFRVSKTNNIVISTVLSSIERVGQCEYDLRLQGRSVETGLNKMTPSSICQYTICTNIYKQPLSVWIYNDLIWIRNAEHYQYPKMKR